MRVYFEKKEKPELMARLYESDRNCDGNCKNCVTICGTTQNTIFLEAADAIEKLQAAVPKWISVDERSPETGKTVLLHINCEKARPHTGFLTVDGEFMHDVIGDMSRSKWKVTHWMPLPEPPKEVE